MEKVEFLILRNLLHNEEYARKVIPFIKSEYFEDTNQKIIFEEILNFIQEYNQLPTKEVLCIETEKRK
jgi:replicative DNA helicase